ncbi:NAD(P)/FAD-dependent oxidoreductase [Arthrobacter sp. ZGTC131]|uniref:NAD(P)/FAD-dependent oxidoreductase n=1 Tax=Arthrobacter sp. ZGTC131 TaxID=2058898 RepID=UPI000CE2BA9A|nr:FAD-dependent oxidoreductase [Arthrobacter sp. ZGTC131]
MNSIAIIGASLAGLSAARALRTQGYSGRLVIIGDEDHRPYDRPPLSKDFLAGRINTADLLLETADDDLQAEWRLGVPAEQLDPQRRVIRLRNGTEVPFDGVVLATGASARMLPELAGKRNVHTLRSLDDAQKLRAQLLPGASLVVIGAGFIGAEVASTAKELGVHVTILEMAEVPLLGPLGAQMGAVLGDLHGLHGVDLVCGVRVETFHVTGDTVTGVKLDDGRELKADVVVVGIGAVPNIGWLAGTGLELGNGVICDSMGRTSIPGVVAVGDCAAWFDHRSGAPERVEHWTGALERPARAAVALLNTMSDSDSPSDDSSSELLDMPYFWSEQYGLRLQFIGTARGADRIQIEAGDPKDHSFLAVYYRDDTPVGALGLNQPRLFTRWRKSLNKGTVLSPQSVSLA